MAAKFENLKISPGFLINFRKSPQISKNYLKSSESYIENLWGVLKDPPGLNRVKLIIGLGEPSFLYLRKIGEITPPFSCSKT